MNCRATLILCTRGGDPAGVRCRWTRAWVPTNVWVGETTGDGGGGGGDRRRGEVGEGAGELEAEGEALGDLEGVELEHARRALVERREALVGEVLRALGALLPVVAAGAVCLAGAGV